MEKLSESNRFAQSASALGAGILGFGIGIKWGLPISAYGIPIIIAGAIFHVFGMHFMQMRNKAETKFSKWLWISAWICLMIIVGIFFYTLF